MGYRLAEMATESHVILEMVPTWREIPEEKYRLLYAGQSTAVGGMRKFVAAMSTTFVPRVGLYCYRTGAQESAGADSGG